MSFGYSNRTWECPYFQWDRYVQKTGIYEIHCSDKSRIMFRTKAGYSSFADKLCGCKDYAKCPIAKKIEAEEERLGIT